ncbi:MAG TPA: E2/UBC family protein [Pyrinomonadaceae bacterium]|jgi:hypothetical protein
MRRQFSLPEADETYLESLGLPWEAIIENGVRWLLLHGYTVFPGYNHSSVTAAIRIGTGYPEAQLDMVYFHPPLARLDRVTVTALTPYPLDGKTYQQWSRHRSGVNPWRPGEDDLSTHLALVNDWLEREFRLKRSA